MKIAAKLSASSTALRCSYPDSLYIDQDRSEYSLCGQNIPLLQSLARPLEDASEETLRSVFFSAGTGMQQPVKVTVRLNRSWPLLIMLFLILTTEWILRRKFKTE